MADFVLTRSCEMTISREEFLRVLPDAVAHQSYHTAGDALVHGDAARGWRIRLTPLPDLVLGLIRLPRQRVDFEFAGHAATEIEAFFRRFDLHFSRGGG